VNGRDRQIYFVAAAVVVVVVVVVVVFLLMHLERTMMKPEMRMKLEWDTLHSAETEVSLVVAEQTEEDIAVQNEVESSFVAVGTADVLELVPFEM